MPPFQASSTQSHLRVKSKNARHTCGSRITAIAKSARDLVMNSTSALPRRKPTLGPRTMVTDMSGVTGNLSNITPNSLKKRRRGIQNWPEPMLEGNGRQKSAIRGLCPSATLTAQRFDIFKGVRQSAKPTIQNKAGHPIEGFSAFVTILPPAD